MEKACLLIHGFTGGPFEVSPLADRLRAEGTYCRIPTLPGHGEVHPRHRSHIIWQDWVQAMEVEAKDLSMQYGAFDLVGFSMGGLIAAYIANRFPVRRLVLLNTAVIYVSPGRFLKEMNRRLQAGDWSYYTKIKGTPIRTTIQFMRLVRQLKPEISRLQLPTFIAQGQQDQIVHPASARYLEKKIAGDKVVHYFPKSRHLICLDVEAEELFDKVERFLNG
jgi:carboxylesterase